MDRQDTGDFIVEWLRDTAGMRFFQVVDHLARRATEYVAGIESRTGKRERLTIIAAAFVAHKSRVAIISNFEDSVGQISQAALPDLRVSWTAYRPGDVPVVLVTGNKPAVPRREREVLRDAVADASEDSGRVRREIQYVNRTASRTSVGKGSISEECTVVSIDSSGGGMQDLQSVQGIELGHVTNGFSFSLGEILAHAGETLSGATLVGASFATSKPTTRRAAQCTRSIVDSGNSEYLLREISYRVDGDSVAYGISRDGMILAADSLEEDRAHKHYWCWTEAEGRRFYDVEPTMDTSGCLNAEGDAALVYGQRGRQEAGVYFRSGRDSRALEIPNTMGEPTLAAINSTGGVCGSIAINRDNTDGSRERPAYWDQDGRLHIISDLMHATSGRAVHVDDEGIVLVWASYGMWGRACLIWNLTTNEVKQVPGEIIPIYMTSRGAVLGFDRANGRDAPVISYDQQTWTRQPLNNGFAPVFGDNLLNIGGNVTVDGYSRVWSAVVGRPAVILPSYEYHHAHGRTVNDSGVIVGQLNADYEQHVVTWTPGKR